MLDRNIDNVVGKATAAKTSFITKYNSGKEEVITKAKGYKSVISD